MNLSIESKIIAIVEADALDRLPALVLSHAKQDGAAAIRWATKDEFGQPILFRILESGDFDVISELLPLIEGSVFETLRDDVNCNALHFSVLSGNGELAEAVLAKAPNLVNEKDSEGCLPIHWAAKHGKTKVLPFTLSDGLVDSEDDTSSHWTPLHYAASSNKLEAAQWLIKNGAEKNKKDSFGRTPLDLASERSYLQLTDVLKS